MKLFYLDDDDKYFENICLASELIYLEEGIRLTPEYYAPKGDVDDFLFFDKNGKTISDIDEMSSELSPRLCYQKTVIDNLSIEKDMLFILDVNFSPSNNINLIDLEKYGLWLAKYLCEAGVSYNNILILTRYPEEARERLGLNKKLYWCDQIPKADLNKDDRANAEIIFNRILRPARNASLKQPKVYLELSTPRRLISLAQSIEKPVIGTSPKLIQVLSKAERIAKSNLNVVITGETGVGKENLANFIHSSSNRSKKEFKTFNCAAYSDELANSELFGHVPGAFTGALREKKGLFELADKGTLFMDEIGDLSERNQALVLRAIQEKKFNKMGSNIIVDVDIRIICATNKNIDVSKGPSSFRQDLFYRLNGISFELIPLRDRLEDISLLIDHFSSNYAKEYPGQKLNLSQDAIFELQHHTWPGNIRELKNVVERLIVSVDGIVTPAHLIEFNVIQKRFVDTQNALDSNKTETLGNNLRYYKEKICDGKSSFLPKFKSLILKAKHDEASKKLVGEYLLAVLREAIENPESFKSTPEESASYKHVTLALLRFVDLENNEFLVNKFLNFNPPIDLRSEQLGSIRIPSSGAVLTEQAFKEHIPVCLKILNEI